jgi:hypothetical protein
MFIVSLSFTISEGLPGRPYPIIWEGKRYAALGK